MADRRGSKGRAAGTDVPVRGANYRNLRNPFTPQREFSDDAVAALHTAPPGE